MNGACVAHVRVCVCVCVFCVCVCVLCVCVCACVWHMCVCVCVFCVCVCLCVCVCVAHVCVHVCVRVCVCVCVCVWCLNMILQATKDATWKICTVYVSQCMLYSSAGEANYCRTHVVQNKRFFAICRKMLIEQLTLI